jgi:hypothetical protein
MKKNGTTVTSEEVSNAYSTCETRDGCVMNGASPKA